MKKVYLGLGANVGDRSGYIESAIAEIKKIPETKLIRSSHIYETAPWGEIEQDDYLNSVVEIETELDAEALLKKLKIIEKEMGRTITKKWDKREIDIDLLFYGNKIIENDFMNVPHTRIESRKFVLIPMNEIAQDFVHPVLGKSISELLKATKDDLNVILYKKEKSGINN